jgi:signal transduction histidine kinase
MLDSEQSSQRPTTDPVALRKRIQSRRGRQFMVAQSTLLGIAIVAVTISKLTGLMADLVFVQSVTFCVVVGLLYVDSVLALLYAYIAGEFETPALLILALCVAMAPIFVGKAHAWGLASVQTALYAGLLLLRTKGWAEGFFPYGYLLPAEDVNDLGFVVDSLSNFTIAIFGMAFLAGQASIDILNSQEQLEHEVEAKTRELARATSGLQTANAELATLNSQLGRANQDLRLSNGRLAQFNAAVSHDLRSPLQTMVARAELIAMLMRANPDRAERMADEIIEAAVQMSRQIDELLKLARVGDRLGDLEPVSLARVVSQASQNLHEAMRTHSARLELVHPLPTAMGNAPLLQELFQNLLENSIKYGARVGPVIRVAPAEAPPGHVALAVEDNGGGIPLDRREHVFGLFKRLEAHGGEIRVEDGRDLTGARLVVTLLAPPSAEPSRSQPPAAAPRVH